MSVVYGVVAFLSIDVPLQLFGIRSVMWRLDLLRVPSQLVLASVVVEACASLCSECVCTSCVLVLEPFGRRLKVVHCMLESCLCFG